MWKIVLVTVLLAALGQGLARAASRRVSRRVGGRGGGDGGMDGHDHGNSMETVNSCGPSHEPTVHVMVHRDGHDHPERPHTCPSDQVINIHVEGSSGRRDPFHGNPIPGAGKWAMGKDTHAKCEIVGGSIDLSGTIYLKQDMMGHGPVHAKFDLSGFSAGMAHDHSFTVGWWGNTADQCAHTGDVFTLPHRMPGAGRGGHHVHHGHHSSEEDENHVDHVDHGEHNHARAKRETKHKFHTVDGETLDEHSGHQRHGPRMPQGHKPNRVEGVIGDLPCDDAGNMDMHETEIDSITLVGFHAIFGRSIVIRNTAGHNHGDSAEEPHAAHDEILACCTIARSTGAHPWGYDDGLNIWLDSEDEAAVVEVAESDESQEGHGGHAGHAGHGGHAHHH